MNLFTESGSISISYSVQDTNNGYYRQLTASRSLYTH